MNKAKLRRPPTAVLIAIIAVVVLVGTTVAWLTFGEAITTRVYSLSNFNAYAEVYFEGGTNPPETYRNLDGSVSVDLTNSSAENYIGKIRVDVYYKGRGSAYVRLKTIQQWQENTPTPPETNKRILQVNNAIPYTIAKPYLSTDSGNQEKWFDNRADDYCLYYATRLTAVNESYTLAADAKVITGVNIDQLNAIKPDNATLKIGFTLEAVQVNRYPQFWGLESLPWLD